MASKDWRKALLSQPAYRIVNRTFHGQMQFITTVAIIGLLLLIFLYVFPKTEKQRFLNSYATASSISKNGGGCPTSGQQQYNATYPLTTPIRKQSTSVYTYRIGLIADLDTNSKSEPTQQMWSSYLLKGHLSFSLSTNYVSVQWDKNSPLKLSSGYSLKGRGMELSELVVFNGKLLAFDDRTGLIFEIHDDQVIPWVLLLDGNGRNSKGFKSEWATVKDEHLIVGSMGKEWTTASGQFLNSNPQYVKKVDVHGVVTHVNWVAEYKRIREVERIQWPGYMIHESGVWSAARRQWYFLPRRCSHHNYNETLDEQRGCSLLITADEHLRRINAVQLVSTSRARGFSSFKFVPNTNEHVIVALRTEEVSGKTATYLTVFTVDGKILLDDLFVANIKYEGLEFI